MQTPCARVDLLDDVATVAPEGIFHRSITGCAGFGGPSAVAVSCTAGMSELAHAAMAGGGPQAAWLLRPGAAGKVGPLCFQVPACASSAPGNEAEE